MSADPALVAEFANEVSEHLDASEQILVAASVEAPSPDDINLLFRSFHSIKGLARVIAFGPLEGIAHEAESLLEPSLVFDDSRVRKIIVWRSWLRLPQDLTHLLDAIRRSGWLFRRRHVGSERDDLSRRLLLPRFWSWIVHRFKPPMTACP